MNALSFPPAWLLSCGMGEGQEQQYVEQLRGVFDSFDQSGRGSLSRDELLELCASLQLQEAAPALLQALLLSQDQRSARVDFEQFKNALILVLSSTLEEPPVEQEPPPKPASPEIQPKFVKGSKRYGRRSTPEFTEPASDQCQSGPEGDRDENYESAVPRKRERWNTLETSTGEEYEAEGQLHLWNPDEPGTPRGSVCALSERLEQRVQEVCLELALPWDGFASHNELLTLCEHLGLEISGDALQTLNGDAAMSVQEFVSRALKHNKPPTPSASTPYRQLKRMHSTQPFDEVGRRIATPSAFSSTIGLKLFSTLDDGTGFTPAEHVLDSWVEEGIENSSEILQALNFSLEGKLSLGDLTVALETELLETKNGVLQAALASFRAEIRHLLACVDRERREKEKLQSDLEKAERLKTQLATEVDEHHAAIEHTNKLNLSKLEQENKEKLCGVRSELMSEMEQMQVQAAAQREELEAQIEKVRGDESFLRDHLSISVKENRRLEMELLDTAEKLVDAQDQIAKLQTNMDNIMKEKFGDLDPGSAEFFLQEERIKQLHISYEAQCRELQDRIDELQSELNDFHSIGRVHQTSSKALSEELESKSPGNESDPGLGTEEVQPFSLSLEAEMMLEQFKDRHLQEMEELREHLENKISEFEDIVEKQRTSHEEQRAALAQQHQDEMQALRAEKSRVQTQAEELQRRLEQVQMEPSKPEQNQDKELEALQEEEIQTLRQHLLESHIKNADLDEQLRSLEEQQSEINDGFNKEIKELKQKHSQEISKLEQTQAEMFVKMEDERSRLSSEFEKEKEALKQNHECEIRARLDQERVRFEKEKEEIVQRLTEQWQKEKAQLDEQNTNSLQVLLEEEMLKLVKEHEDREVELKEQWEKEKAQIQQKHEENVLERLRQQTIEFERKEKKLKEECEMEKAQLEEDFEGMVQERASEEVNKTVAEREEEEKRFEREMREEREKMEERHQETVKELTQRHREERDELHSTLDKLKEDIALERRQIESSFGLRLSAVEDRFETDQEAVAQRFQADVLKLEQSYQDELKIMRENHEREQRRWEEETKNAEEQKRNVADVLEKERAKTMEEWTMEMQEINNVHIEEMEAVDLRNKQLQRELDEIVFRSQLKEVNLSKQLNELHDRLQQSLETREELVSQVQKQAIETERMLRETIQMLQEEKSELLQNRAELEAKYKEIVSISETQIAERIELLTERDDLKIKMEELEVLVNKMPLDFDVERKNLQRIITDLEEKGAKWGKIKELEMEASQVLNFVQKVKIDGIGDENEIGDCYEIISKLGTSATNSTKSPSSLDEDSIDILGSPIEENEFDKNECILSRSESCDVQEDSMASTDSLDNPFCEHGQSQTNEKPCPNDELDESISDGGEKRVLYTSVDPNLTLCPDQKPHCGDQAFKDKVHAVFSHAGFINADDFSRPEVLEGANVARDGSRCHNTAFCDLKPQHVPDFEVEESSLEDFCLHEAAVDAEVPEDANDLGQWLEGAGSNRDKSNNGFLMPEMGFSHFDGTNASSESQDVLKLKALYKTATEENVLLQEKVSLLQQKIEILEILLTHNNEKLKTGHQVLEENYSLKVKLLLLMEHIKELEKKAFKMSDLQIRYEDCACENDKLKEQNAELEKRVWSLESSANIYGFQHSKVTLADEIDQMRAENRRLSGLLEELDSSNGNLLTIRANSRASASPVREEIVDFDRTRGGDLEDCCDDYEKENAKLRRAIADLQDQSQILTETTKVHRSEACRLSEENLVLKKNIDALKEEDLKELMKTLDTLKKEKDASQIATDDFKKRISELQSQSVLLKNKNGILCEKNSRHLNDVQTLKQQVAALAETKEKTPTKDKKQLSACVSALEAELTKALNETVTLKQRNSLLSLEVSALREKMKSLGSFEQQLSSLSEEKRTLVKETQALCNQLSKAQEKAKASDENLQAATLQSSRLKADVRVLQQQKDSLQHEVALIHKKLQNANDKNHVLERALHSTGLQSHSKKLLREELARLMEQEQKLLKQENEKLQGEVLSVKAELRQARDKVRQMDSTVVSLKQHKQSHSSMLLALEQENVTLKQELEAQKEKNEGRDAATGGPDVESVLQENEALKSQMARLSSQLIETFQAQLVGLLPPSPHRTPRGPPLRDEAELAQDDRDRKMRGMEERMREIELSLRNVKLLLKEKVVQLKDQLHKNGKADVLIKDLYLENDDLLKALEVTEQRHKIAEKKNYLLEEKISSLSKILRELSPSTLPTLQYHFACS